MNRESGAATPLPKGTETEWPHFFTRQPLSSFGRITVVAQLGAVVGGGILAITIGYPSNMALLIVTAALLVVAGLAAIRFRWMPALVTVLNAVFLYQIAAQPFVIEHLENPKTDGFVQFVLDLLITAFIFVAFGAAIGATVQNYRQGDRRAPRWLPSALIGLTGVVIGAILLAAITQPAAATVTGTQFTNGIPTVHMSGSVFNQASVTIPKGFKLMLVDDVPILHILVNGSWENGAARSAREPGAPLVNNVQVNGNSIEIGPFTTAGTYHIYCSIHQGMNLTVIVQ